MATLCLYVALLVGLKPKQKNVNSDSLMVPLWLLVLQRFSAYSSANLAHACKLSGESNYFCSINIHMQEKSKD